MGEQYALLCAIGNLDEALGRYDSGLQDFARLLHIDGVTRVAIDWSRPALLVGTDCIDVIDESGILRELGHYVISFLPKEKAYTVENVTRTVDMCAHPHAMQGSSFCMSTGSEQVRISIADGRYSTATAILVQALKMRQGHVEVGVAYGSGQLGKWPIKEV